VTGIGRVAVVAALCAAALGGCAGSNLASAPVPDSANSRCAVTADASAARGDWLIGSWSHPNSRLDMVRDGEVIRWRWERDPGVVTVRWGAKSKAAAEGTVTQLSGCAAVMKGVYTESTTSVQVGRPMEHRLSLVSPTRLEGTWYGAGREWLPVSWTQAR